VTTELKTLLIDDLRDIAAQRVARTYDEGIQALKDGSWDILYLDHDLGDPDEKKTGYGVMCFLEENEQFLPRKIVLVTSNPVGRKNMQAVIDRLYRGTCIDCGAQTKLGVGSARCCLCWEDRCAGFGPDPRDAS
jgi:hypothetical protein